MKFEGIKCDVCGQIKDTSNHWLLAQEIEHGFWISDWQESLADREGVMHLCGEACMVKEQSKHLRKPQIAPPPEEVQS
jgi:hypothetical protein